MGPDGVRKTLEKHQDRVRERQGSVTMASGWCQDIMLVSGWRQKIVRIPSGWRQDDATRT